jgi:hypothetical protein
MKMQKTPENPENGYKLAKRFRRRRRLAERITFGVR